MDVVGIPVEQDRASPSTRCTGEQRGGGISIALVGGELVGWELLFFKKLNIRLQDTASTLSSLWKSGRFALSSLLWDIFGARIR